ncbi:Transmembrane and TPR repeat-containing protein 1 [Chelonia mydas]|uniref:Transmembrane and TPR repeat-containing protein 1 n=1 Tax=Chelonia mydas TaxID=8469 RepID=M7BK02_CHEMY|nr:Transmembrane and TPR repeat-containing protein 1 [Chelonia mydas]
MGMQVPSSAYFKRLPEAMTCPLSGSYAELWPGALHAAPSAGTAPAAPIGARRSQRGPCRGFRELRGPAPDPTPRPEWGRAVCMGYCILFVHGLKKLCAWLNRWGTTALTLSALLLLLLFSWKTVKQNEIWLSRESLFRSGVQTLPHNAKVHYNYANFLKDQGRNSEAIYHYKTALKIPTPLGLFGVRAGPVPDRLDAHTNATEMKRLYPRHASALNNLGTLTKDLVEAKEYYRRALQLNPQHNRALFNLGNLLKSQGKKEEAVFLLRDSIKYGPEFADAYSSLASLLAEQAQVLAMMGQTKEAEKMTNHIVTEEAKCLECYRLLSAIYSKQERYSKALEAIDKALQLKPKDPKVLSELFFTKGNQLREQNLLDKAFESYKVAVELNPDQAQAWMNMGGIEHIKGDYVNARSYYKKALQLVPNSKLLKENLAKLDRLEKRLQEVQEKDQT